MDSIEALGAGDLGSSIAPREGPSIERPVAGKLGTKMARRSPMENRITNLRSPAITIPH